ncbi:unnamed protein product [Tilletia laevis]|nr:unnamed protein product [Tilletia caries]CAD6965056.1 unnamed protein product [Tilletia laevis]
MAVDAGPTLVEQLSFSSAARPFKNPAFTRVMSKRNETLKQIVTTEREAALGLITSGKRKGKRPTAVEAAAVMAAGGVAAEAPFELTIKGPGGRKMRLVGAAARAAQARQLREQKAKEDADAEASGMVGDDVEAGAGAELEAGNADVQDAIMEDAEVKEAEELIAPSTSAMATPAPEGAIAEGSMESTPVPVALLDIKPRREGASYFSVDAPPSLRPRRRYCDITGLLGPYTDPKSRLRYHNAEIYTAIRRFGPGVDQQYLALRGDAHTIK